MGAHPTATTRAGDNAFHLAALAGTEHATVSDAARSVRRRYFDLLATRKVPSDRRNVSGDPPLEFAARLYEERLISNCVPPSVAQQPEIMHWLRARRTRSPQPDDAR